MEARRVNYFAIATVERLTDQVQKLAHSVLTFESGYVSGEGSMQAGVKRLDSGRTTARSAALKLSAINESKHQTVIRADPQLQPSAHR